MIDLINNTTIGILTAENPFNRKPDQSAFNYAQTNLLETDIRGCGLLYERVETSHMYNEKSFIVYNISFDLSFKLSRKYNQTCFIFGDKIIDGNDILFRWRILESETLKDTHSPIYYSGYTKCGIPEF